MNKKALVVLLLGLMSLSSLQAGICESTFACCGRFLDRYGLKILAGYVACGGALALAAVIQQKNRQAYFRGWNEGYKYGMRWQEVNGVKPNRVDAEIQTETQPIDSNEISFLNN